MTQQKSRSFKVFLLIFFHPLQPQSNQGNSLIPRHPHANFRVNSLAAALRQILNLVHRTAPESREMTTTNGVTPRTGMTLAIIGCGMQIWLVFIKYAVANDLQRYDGLSHFIGRS